MRQTKANPLKEWAEVDGKWVYREVKPTEPLPPELHPLECRCCVACEAWAIFEGKHGREIALEERRMFNAQRG